MTQTGIPFWFMRGGTSRGPCFNRAHLPEDRDDLARVLASAIGSGHPLNIDGIGGGNAVTTKVAMLSESKGSRADIDYFFAQVSVADRHVDFGPTCGNMLSAVGPAAIEMGLIKPAGGETAIDILAVNTGAKARATVQTDGIGVVYEGNISIDGVPGTAAPVALQFMDTVGGVTGALLPTGKIRNQFDGIEVTCMDVAMPMVVARAESFGLSGNETAAELDSNRDFFDRMEALRIRAGEAMGITEAATSVTPKFGLLSPARKGGTATARYFMPWTTHPAMAVTGAQCLASCILAPGSVADSLAPASMENPARIALEHPSGRIDVLVEFDTSDSGFNLVSAGIMRTARLIARGEVMVPRNVWTLA